MQPKMTAKDAAEFLGISLQAINKSLKTKDLDVSKSANRLYFGHDSAKSLFNLPTSKQTIAFQIVKGGTGKTALAFNVAVRASLYGLKVLCIDLDQQGNLTDMLGVHGDDYKCMLDSITDPNVQFKDLIITVNEGIDLVPSNLDNALIENTLTIKKIRLDKVYSTRIDSIRNQYDVIIIDCPPALGANNAAIALASDTIITVVDPDRNAFKGLQYSYDEIKRLIEEYDKENLSIRIALNKFDKRTSLSHDTLETLIKHRVFGSMLYKTYIGVNQQIPNSSAQGVTIFDSLKDSTAKQDIDLLTREIFGLDEALRLKKSLSNKQREFSEDKSQPVING